MSLKPHPVAMTSAILSSAAFRSHEGDHVSSLDIADLASRIHRCGMAIRRGVPAGNDKAMERAHTWRKALNVELEAYGCDLVISMVGNMLLRYPGMKHPHGIC